MAKKSDHLQLVQQSGQLPRWKRALRLLFRLTFLVALVFLLKYGETFFRVSEITVTGTGEISANAILEAGGIKPGISMFFLQEAKIAESVTGKYPEIKSVEIERKLPDTLIIKVAERVQAAYLLTADGYWLIDKEAVCFGHVSDPVSDYPVISGVGRDLIMPGEPLRCQVRRETLRSFFRSWTGNEQLSVESIDFTDSYNLVANSAAGLEIWLGDGKDMDYKLLLVRETIPHLGDATQARLDVRSGKRLVVSGSILIGESGVEP